MTLYIDTRPQLGNWVEKTSEPAYHIWDCDTVFGRYTIALLGSKYELWFYGITYRNFKPSKTFTLAKAAAQADYDARTAERFRPAKEILDLLERASWLVGNAGTNISGSTDLACTKWQEDYKAIAKAKEQP
jgi:hypothetical protein